MNKVGKVIKEIVDSQTVTKGGSYSPPGPIATTIMFKPASTNMNIQETFDTIATKYAKQASDMQDSAAFAYVTKLLDRIKEAGADPADYEVVVARDEYPQYVDGKDGTKMKVEYRIRLERRKDLENLPVIRGVEG